MSNTPTSKVEALREQIQAIRRKYIANAYRPELLEHDLAWDEDYLQAFATFLEELELPRKRTIDTIHEYTDNTFNKGVNHGIGQTRTLIQAQVKELRKI